VVRALISKEKDPAFDPTVTLPAARKGRSAMGTRKAKISRDEAPAMEMLQLSINKCTVSVAMNNVTREEKYDA
jgi:hypothetical protein